jgi:hypothetical protein
MNKTKSRTSHNNRSTSNTPNSRSTNDISSNETSTTEISIISSSEIKNKSQASKQISSFKTSSMVRSNSTFSMKSKPMVEKKERKVQSAMPDIPISHSEENIAKHQQEKKVARKVDDKDLHNVYAAVRKLFSCNLISIEISLSSRRYLTNGVAIRF